MDGSCFSSTKRRSIRLPLKLPVIIESANSRTHGETANVGFGGAFIKTLERPVYGEQIKLWVSLRKSGSLSGVPCAVRWVDPSGFGVQFLELGAQDTHALIHLVRAHVR